MILLNKFVLRENVYFDYNGTFAINIGVISFYYSGPGLPHQYVLITKYSRPYVKFDIVEHNLREYEKLLHGVRCEKYNAFNVVPRDEMKLTRKMKRKIRRAIKRKIRRASACENIMYMRNSHIEIYNKYDKVCEKFSFANPFNSISYLLNRPYYCADYVKINRY